MSSVLKFIVGCLITAAAGAYLKSHFIDHAQEEAVRRRAVYAANKSLERTNASAAPNRPRAPTRSLRQSTTHAGPRSRFEQLIKEGVFSKGSRYLRMPRIEAGPSWRRLSRSKREEAAQAALAHFAASDSKHKLLTLVDPATRRVIATYTHQHGLRQ